VCVYVRRSVCVSIYAATLPVCLWQEGYIANPRSRIYIYMCVYIYIYTYIYDRMHRYMISSPCPLLLSIGLFDKRNVISAIIGSHTQKIPYSVLRSLFCKRDAIIPPTPWPFFSRAGLFLLFSFGEHQILLARYPTYSWTVHNFSHPTT